MGAADLRALAAREADRLWSYASRWQTSRAHSIHGERLGMTVEEVGELLAAIRRLRKKMPGEERRQTSKTGPIRKVEVEQVEDDRLAVDVRGQGLVRNLDDLVREAGIDLTTWRVERHRVNSWPVAQKGPDGKPQVTRLWQVRADLVRRYDQDVRPVAERTPMPRARPEPRDVRCAVVIPDTQHGFRREGKTGRLIPMHDRRAIDAAIQLVELLNPDEVVLLGDMLDLAPWSTRWPRPKEHADTTQPALEELHVDLRRIRAAAPEARVRYLEGNHENRIDRAIVDGLKEAGDLRAVGDDLPALSVERLLRLDLVEVEYVGPYGADFYLWDRVRLTHGERVRNKGGATATAVISDAVASTGFGHVHRVERASKTVRTPEGPRTITAWTPGCLCRVDGEVPGVSAHPDWQQGVAVLWWDGEQEHTQLVEIHDGRLVWGGMVLEGRDRGDWYAKQTGWPVG